MNTKISFQIRELILNSIIQSRRGHIGSALSIVEILYVLYFKHMNISKNNINNLKRDRFILSKGHGCLALYVILYLKNFINLKDLNSFCLENSLLGGHPESHLIPGVEFSTGSLGHGLSVAVGMAISSKLNNLKNQVYVLLGDGELQEGSIWEAAMSCNNKNLNNLNIIIDYKLQTFDFVSNITPLEPIFDKWKSFGFEVYSVDGHSFKNIDKILNKIKKIKKPCVLICNTTKGKGIKSIENIAKWHHNSNISLNEIDNFKKELQSYYNL